MFSILGFVHLWFNACRYLNINVCGQMINPLPMVIRKPNEFFKLLIQGCDLKSTNTGDYSNICLLDD